MNNAGLQKKRWKWKQNEIISSSMSWKKKKSTGAKPGFSYGEDEEGHLKERLNT